MASLEPRKKLLLTFATTLGYTLLFALLNPLLGAKVSALSLVPVGLTGWFFGIRAGVLAGFLLLPYNVLFSDLFFPSMIGELLQSDNLLLTFTVPPLVGGTLGHLRNLDLKIREQNRELEYRASHDVLTGLPNHALFEDRFEHALASSTRAGKCVAVLVLDLDNFKVINDSLGHRAGDELLLAVADRLRDCVRPEDTVARFGGDEYVILLEGISDQRQASQIADRVAQALHVPFEIQEHEVWVTASTGIKLSSPVTEQPPRAEDLLRDADAAMYRVKGRGKAHYRLFKPEMKGRAAEHLKLQSELRRALEREEFVLYYQPQVRLETSPRKLIKPVGSFKGTSGPSFEVGRHPIVGVEALVRCEHPQRGLLAPSEFLPIAEEMGLIFPIGEWILWQACRQAKEWRERLSTGPRLLMFCNVSVLQFQNESYVEDVGEALAKSGLDPSGLVLELTEGTLMEDPESATVKLEEINSLGVGLALDDFGTVYSSLSYLRRFPVDYLKVDISFVEKLGTEGGKAMISGLVYLAHVLGVNTVAEGVQTSEELKQLRLLGCDMAQGQCLSWPLPGGSVEPLLEKGYLPCEHPALPEETDGELGSADDTA